MKALAIGLWLAAWACAGLIPASWLVARDGKQALARAEFAAGMIGTAALGLAGAAAW